MKLPARPLGLQAKDSFKQEQNFNPTFSPTFHIGLPHATPEPTPPPHIPSAPIQNVRRPNVTLISVRTINIGFEESGNIQAARELDRFTGIEGIIAAFRNKHTSDVCPAFQVEAKLRLYDSKGIE